MGLLPMKAKILPPSDDHVFKLLLTSPEAKPALTDLVSAIIKRPVTNVVVRHNEIPVEDTREKAERLDVNCKVDDGSQIDLEMQASRVMEIADGKHNNLKGKSIYYLCDLHSSQPAKGVPRYDLLARTYQVTFCSYRVFRNRKEYVNSFSMRHDEDNELFSDAIRVIYVELCKLKETVMKPVIEMTDLEKWAVFFRYADNHKKRGTVNKIIESKEALQMAGELLMTISQDERERARIRSRKMFETDLASDMATAMDIGRKKGRKEGRKEGRQEGKREGIREGRQEGKREEALAIAQNLLEMKMPIEQIVTATGLTREEVQKLKI